MADSPDKFSSTSVSSLVTDMAPILTSGALVKNDSTLVSNLVTDASNTGLNFPLFPFPNISLPFRFHCITGIDVTYYQLLSYNHSAWIESILPILQLLIKSFRFKYTFLFNHRDPDNHCPFGALLPFV